MKSSNNLERKAGILLHPTSLYSKFGIGDLGPNAYEFIDFLYDSGMSYWQILPLGPTGFGASPYQTISAFAGNPLLISPEKLKEKKYLDDEDFNDYIFKIKKREKEIKDNYNLIEFQPIRELKEFYLRKAFKKFKKLNKHEDLRDFAHFCEENNNWLEDFAIFKSLRTFFQEKHWIQWPKPLKNREKQAINAWVEDHQDEIQYVKFIQWCFFEQWNQIKNYANQKKIKIIGDMPIFVSYDSVDVWMNPDYFLLNEDGTLKYQAGVPPDYFSETGQLWGNPLYNWEKLKEINYLWFIERFKQLLKLVDMIRVDHFRGFEAFWQIPGDAKTAIHGEWIKAPGKELFETILNTLGKLPLIAEDLGLITPEVEQLRDYFNFPGMRVLQFAFGGDANNPHLPHNYIDNCICYTGTHDNNTILGWWKEELSNELRIKVADYLGFELNSFLKSDLEKDSNLSSSDFRNESKEESDLNANQKSKSSEKISRIVKNLIKAIMRSVAATAIIPIQDILLLDSGARMNIPGEPEGNWKYQMIEKQLSNKLSNDIKILLTLYGRTNK